MCVSTPAISPLSPSTRPALKIWTRPCSWSSVPVAGTGCGMRLRTWRRSWTVTPLCTRSRCSAARRSTCPTSRHACTRRKCPKGRRRCCRTWIGPPCCGPSTWTGKGRSSQPTSSAPLFTRWRAWTTRACTPPWRMVPCTPRLRCCRRLAGCVSSRRYAGTRSTCVCRPCAWPATETPTNSPLSRATRSWTTTRRSPCSPAWLQAR